MKLGKEAEGLFKNVKKAKALSVRIKHLRRKLRPYITLAKAGRELNEEQFQYARALISQIEDAKAQLERTGFPVEASIEASKTEKLNRKHKKKKKLGRLRRKPKARFKKGGVGLYGFGASLRTWK